MSGDTYGLVYLLLHFLLYYGNLVSVCMLFLHGCVQLTNNSYIHTSIRAHNILTMFVMLLWHMIHILRFPITPYSAHVHGSPIQIVCHLPYISTMRAQTYIPHIMCLKGCALFASFVRKILVTTVLVVSVTAVLSSAEQTLIRRTFVSKEGVKSAHPGSRLDPKGSSAISCARQCLTQDCFGAHFSLESGECFAVDYPHLYNTTMDSRWTLMSGNYFTGSISRLHYLFRMFRRYSLTLFQPNRNNDNDNDKITMIIMIIKMIKIIIIIIIIMIIIIIIIMIMKIMIIGI